MQSLVSMRNVLAHEYFDVTEESIYHVYEQIGSVKKLTEQIKQFILKNNQK